MKIAVIANKKTDDIEKLIIAFNDVGLEASYLRVEKLSMYTQKNKTEVTANGLKFSDFDACFLAVSPEFTQFIEPLLDHTISLGMYCQVKPGAYYINSNIPFQLAVLNEKQVKIPKTSILPSIDLLDSTAEDYTFPVIVKTFVGLQKTQSLPIESKRAMKAFAKSIKTGLDAITIQDYFEDDLDYALVIGEKVYGMRRKWNESKLEHEGTHQTINLEEKTQETQKKRQMFLDWTLQWSK